LGCSSPGSNGAGGERRCAKCKRCGLRAVTDGFHSTCHRGTLNDTLDDVRDIHSNDKDDDCDAGDRESCLKLIPDIRLVCETNKNLRSNPRDHHQCHQLHPDRERIDQVTDCKVLGEGGTTQTQHDHAGEQAEIHLDHHRHEDRGNKRECDYRHDHRESRRDCERVVLEQPELHLF